MAMALSEESLKEFWKKRSTGNRDEVKSSPMLKSSSQNVLHEVLQQEMKIDPLKNIRLESITMETHDFSQELKFQPLYNLNTRKDYLSNEFQLILRDLPENDPYRQMETDLNEIYNKIRRHHLKELHCQATSRIKPGTFAVVLDTHKDHIGRFKRAKILQVHGNFNQTLICHLIDEGPTTSFPLDQVYLILKPFLQPPPRTLTICLSGVQSLTGSPIFGRLLERTLERLATHEFQVVPSSENYSDGGSSLKEPLIAELFSSGMSCSVNDSVAIEVSSVITEPFQLKNLLRGDVFQRGIISHFNSNGSVWIHFKSRAQKLIRECLKSLEESWPTFTLFRQELQYRKALEGEIGVAIHPKPQRLLRCKILPTSDPSKTGFRVCWIDYGDESQLLVEDLVLTQSINKILRETRPLAKEFQLVNVKHLNCSAYLESLVDSKAELIVRIVEVPGCFSPAHELPQVQLILNEMKGGEWPRLSKVCVNDKLLKRKWAQPSEYYSGFQPRNAVASSPICKLTMEYPSTEWIEPAFPLRSQTLTKGSRITFYVSKLLPDKLIIHPWATKLTLEMVEMKMTDYYENEYWVAGQREDVKEQKRSYPPNGQFCGYRAKDGSWHRAKILKETNKEGVSWLNGREYFENAMVDLLLMDHTTLVTTDYHSIWSLYASSWISSLGPQGAIGKLAHNTSQEPGQVCGNKGNGEEVRNASVGIEDFAHGVGKKISAILEDIDMDGNGVACMTLSFVNGKDF